MSKLKQLFDLSKNERLHKYELHMGEIDIDVYVGHFSKLSVPVEEAAKKTRRMEGFSVVEPEALLILKQGAELARKESEKGFKDRLDIMNLLLNAEIDFAEYNNMLQKYNIPHLKQRLVEIVQGFREGKYLDMNPAELKRSRQALLEKIKGAKK